jgi:hypothetical protein
MAGDDQDPHKNNMGVKVGTETDYGTWDWRKIKVAITGAVNTDAATAADKLPGTSDPQSLANAADAFYYTSLDLQNVHETLKSWHDYLLNPDKPLWRGEAAESFRGLFDKTIASVKGHLDPLKNAPTYDKSLRDAGNDLTYAINKVNELDYAAAKQVIDTYNGDPGKPTFVHAGHHPGGAVVNQKGPPPWYDYNGTTIVMISKYPDIDRQLSVDMRGVLNTLVGQYRSHITSMPPPAPLPQPDPGAPGANGPIKFDKPPPITFGPPPKFPPPPKQPPLPKQPNLGDLGNLKKGPDGQLLGPDGKPIVGPDGKLNDPNLTPPNLVNTPNGPAVVGPDGKTLLDPRTGKPLKGPDGKPLTLDDLPKTGVVPPALGVPPPLKTVKTPGVSEPGEFRAPNLSNLTSGGPPAKSAAELQSEGALKSGAKEFGPAEGAGGKGAAGEKGGGGEPMPMGGGMGGAGQGDKDRDRTTWLTEDEEIWGTETTLNVGVLGR